MTTAKVKMTVSDKSDSNEFYFASWKFVLPAAKLCLDSGKSFENPCESWTT